MNNVLKGRISRGFTIWCGCGFWEYAPTKNKMEAGKYARKSGWKLTRDKGWICPECQKAGGGK